MIDWTKIRQVWTNEQEKNLEFELTDLGNKRFTQKQWVDLLLTKFQENNKLKETNKTLKEEIDELKFELKKLKADKCLAELFP